MGCCLLLWVVVHCWVRYHPTNRPTDHCIRTRNQQRRRRQQSGKLLGTPLSDHRRPRERGRRSFLCAGRRQKDRWIDVHRNRRWQRRRRRFFPPGLLFSFAFSLLEIGLPTLREKVSWRKAPECRQCSYEK